LDDGLGRRRRRLLLRTDRSGELGLRREQLLVLGLAPEVDDPVEVLQEREVDREEVLDLVRRDELEGAQALYEPGQDARRQAGVVRAVDRRVAQGLELVTRRGQPHRPGAVDHTLRVDVPTRQREVVTGLQAHLTRSSRSMTRVMDSFTASVLSTDSWSV